MSHPTCHTLHVTLYISHHYMSHPTYHTTTCHTLHITPTHVTPHVSHPTCHTHTCHTLHVAQLHVTPFMSHHYMSHPTCHTLHVTPYMSRLTCHTLHVTPYKSHPELNVFLIPTLVECHFSHQSVVASIPNLLRTTNDRKCQFGACVHGLPTSVFNLLRVWTSWIKFARTTTVHSV